MGQIFIENAIQNLDITINGNGEEKLDFTYIEDLINGISLCCKNKNAINQTFNLTYGKSKKINELTQILKKEFPDIKIIYKEKEKFMPERGTLDISKAKKLIGYNPINSIDKGYIKYISWYKKILEKPSLMHKTPKNPPPFVIAEIGNNHEGSFDRAKNLLEKHQK